MHHINYTAIFVMILSALLSPVADAQTNIPENVDKLAKQCGMCHGMEGNSTINTIPSIAGISEDYFRYAMEAYKNGNRKSDVMKNFADGLSEDDIKQLAKYYAQQTYQTADQAIDENLAQKGKAVHDKYCAKCHDNKGYTDQYSYGILAGQWMPYLRQTIKEYLDGSRKTNPMMMIKLKRVKNEIGGEGFEQLLNFYAGAKQQPSQSQ